MDTNPLNQDDVKWFVELLRHYKAVVGDNQPTHPLHKDIARFERILNTHQQLLGAKLRLAKYEYEYEEKKTRELCQHLHIVPRVPFDPNDKWFSSSAVCSACGMEMSGWYCHTSPSKVCEYDTMNDPMCDQCIHCGNPDERK